MKLSEAIRLGAMLRPQTQVGGLYAVRSRGILGLTEERLASCALGAALEAIGSKPMPCNPAVPVLPTRAHSDPQGDSMLVPYEWWVVLSQERDCPECPARFTTVRTISHLNDDHRLTREQIADWVATIEPADAVEPLVELMATEAGQ